MNRYAPADTASNNTFHQVYGLATTTKTQNAETISTMSVAVDASPRATSLASTPGFAHSQNIKVNRPTVMPAGIARRNTRRTKPSRARSQLGANDSTKAGIPIVNQPVIVTWIGSKG